MIRMVNEDKMTFVMVMIDNIEWMINQERKAIVQSALMLIMIADDDKNDKRG